MYVCMYEVVAKTVTNTFFYIKSETGRKKNEKTLRVVSLWIYSDGLVVNRFFWRTCKKCPFPNIEFDWRTGFFCLRLLLPIPATIVRRTTSSEYPRKFATVDATVDNNRVQRFVKRIQPDFIMHYLKTRYVFWNTAFTTRSSVFIIVWLTYTKTTGLLDVLKIKCVVWLLIEPNKFVFNFLKWKTVSMPFCYQLL